MGFAFTERHLFESAVRNRGEFLFRRGAVTIDQVTDTHIFAEVESSSGYGTYEIEIVRDDEEIVDMFCTCPYAEDQGCCKHLWATLRELDSRDGQQITAASQAARSGKSETSGKKKKQKQKQKQKTQPRPGVIAVPKVPAWLKELNDLKNAPLGHRDSDYLLHTPNHRPQSFWYVLDIASANRNATITLHLMTQQLRSNGQPGTIKDLTLSDDSIRKVQQQEHRSVLHSLQEFFKLSALNDHRVSYGYYWRPPATSSIRLTPLMQAAILPQIAETGRLCWRLSEAAPVQDARFVTHDRDGVWEPVVEFLRKPDEQQWIVTGRLVRRPFSSSADAVEQVRPMTDILHADASGLVLFPESLAKLRLTNNFAWVQLLRRRSELQVPFSEQSQFITEVMNTPGLSELSLPEDFCPCLTDIPCIPRLRLISVSSLPYEQRQKNSVFATVDFLYEDAAASPLSTAHLLRRESSLIRRDSSAESQALQTLADHQAVQHPSLLNLDELVIELPGSSANHVLTQLLKANWEVEAEGRRIKAPGQMRLGVSSSRDWFELDGKIEFGDVSASLPELLEAAQNGQRFFRLSDGSQGMLPAEWLERYSGLVSLGEVSDDKIRFRPSQAMILDAMLDAQEHVTRDRDFKAYCRKLRDFSGIRPRSPVRTFQGELRDYQKDGLSWLHFLNEFQLGGCLADDMGLGKTVQVLALLEARRTRRPKADEVHRPSLVVVPKSLIFNWINEAARFAPKLKVINHTGLMRHGNELEAADVILTTYGTLRMDIVNIEKMHFDYIILDEAQAIKNSASQAAKVCRLLKSDHRLAMTGTPVENHLGELWSLFEFLNPGMLGASSAFQRLTASKNEQERAASLEMLSRALRPFLLRRTKTQVLKDLPGKTEQILYCEMTGKQKRKYDELKAYYQSKLKSTIDQVGIKRAKIHVLEALLRLRQAACHLGLIDPSRVREESGKLDAIIEQLSQVTADGHKALVFSQFTSFLNIVRKKLDKEKIRYAYLDGSTNNRQAVVQQFQNDEACQLFLISLKAGGHGLNLTSADYVFILDPWWNPAVEAQAVDRAHRIGQDRHVFAYRLITKDTVEERILELQKEKQSLADAIISADASLIRSLTAEDLTLLLS